MSRKSIREQQISEYLSQDSRRSSLVADMIKKGVSRFEPVVDPMQREQLNMLDIKNVGEYINQVKRLADCLIDQLKGWNGPKVSRLRAWTWDNQA